MKFIDEQQNIFIVRHFFDDTFDTLFELTAVFASEYHIWSGNGRDFSEGIVSEYERVYPSGI